MNQQIVEGAVFNFVVKFTNKAGRVLDAPLPTDAAAVLSRPDGGSVSVNPDGTGGKFTAGTVDGDVSLTATAGGFTSPPSDFTVAADTVPAGTVIVPTDVAPAGVAIVPA